MPLPPLPSQIAYEDLIDQSLPLPPPPLDTTITCSDGLVLDIFNEPVPQPTFDSPPTIPTTTAAKLNSPTTTTPPTAACFLPRADDKNSTSHRRRNTQPLTGRAAHFRDVTLRQYTRRQQQTYPRSTTNSSPRRADEAASISQDEASPRSTTNSSPRRASPDADDAASFSQRSRSTTPTTTTPLDMDAASPPIAPAEWEEFLRFKRREKERIRERRRSSSRQARSRNGSDDEQSQQAELEEFICSLQSVTPQPPPSRKQRIRNNRKSPKKRRESSRRSSRRGSSFSSSRSSPSRRGSSSSSSRSSPSRRSSSFRFARWEIMENVGKRYKKRNIKNKKIKTINCHLTFAEILHFLLTPRKCVNLVSGK